MGKNQILGAINNLGTGFKFCLKKHRQSEEIRFSANITPIILFVNTLQNKYNNIPPTI
jgi:hypothetical protein